MSEKYLKIEKERVSSEMEDAIETSADFVTLGE